MAVFAQHTVGEYYFEFDCQQWAAMDEEATADWTVIEDSCGYVEGFGSPYARGLFGASLNGKIRGELPIQVTTEGGITTVDLPDYLVPVSKNTTSAIIPEGAVTSISVTDALLAGEYQDGDVFSVVDQTTGRYVRLEVTTTVGGGDLIISATGTAEFELPAGSVLVPIFSVRTPGGSGLTDGDYGDVTVSGGGTVITIDNNVVTDAKLRDSAASSVIGRAGLTAGDPADIVATTSGHVLKMTDTGLVFTTITTNSIDDGAITDAKLRDSVGLSVIGRSVNTTGDPADIVAGTDGHVLRRSGTTLGFGTVATGGIADNAITDAKLRDSAGLSVIGRATNTTGDPADITAGTDAHVLRRSGTSLGFGQVATGGIADSAVTYAKIQNVAAASRLLGRGSAAGAGVVQEITLGAGLSMTGTTLSSTATGTVDGTGVANRLAFWLDTDTLTSDAAFTVDGANDRMTILFATAGNGAGNGTLNLTGSGAFGVNSEIIRAVVDCTLDAGFLLSNTRNTSNLGSAYMEVATGGSTAADPYFKTTVTGQKSVVFGQDNSAVGDPFRITPDAAKPGGVANRGVTITTDALSLVGVNLDAPKFHMDVAGRSRASTGFVGKGNQWSSGNISFASGAGTGATVNNITGCDNAFFITFTTGTSPALNSTIFTATYPNAFPAALATSFVTWSPADVDAATDLTKFRLGNRSHISFQLVANGTLSASTQYMLCFTVWSMDN